MDLDATASTWPIESRIGRISFAEDAAKTAREVGWHERVLGILLVGMYGSIHPTNLTGLLLALTLSIPVGCQDAPEEPPPPEAGDEVGEDPPEVCKSSCQECADLMKDAYACIAYDKTFEESKEPITTFECIVCDNDGPGSAGMTCETQANLQSIFYTDMEVQPLPCGDSDTSDTADTDDSMGSMKSGECTDWQPSSRVHPSRANEWDIERDFISALVKDPSQLVACDGARMRRSTGLYRVASLVSDDLLSELGFMNDDVIQSINGYAMSGPLEAAQAFFELWPDTRVFTVTVLRPGVGVLTFTYNLV